MSLNCNFAEGVLTYYHITHYCRLACDVDIATGVALRYRTRRVK